MGLIARLIVSATVLLILFCVAISSAINNRDKKYKKLVEGWQIQQELKTNKQVEELSMELEQWLGSLGLPQFEEQRQRAAAARQLSIVLIEKLLETPCPQ